MTLFTLPEAAEQPARTGKPKSNETGNPERDQCQTPPEALWPLLPYILPTWRVWEPCAGEGYLARGLQPRVASVVSGDILTGQNFFNPDSEPESWDVMITNPPFSLKFKWLARCYELGRPFALLMPGDTLFAGKRAQPLFKRYGVEILIPDERINYKMPNAGWDGGGAQFHSAWFTFGLDVGEFVKMVEMRNPAQLELFGGGE